MSKKYYFDDDDDIDEEKIFQSKKIKKNKIRFKRKSKLFNEMQLLCNNEKSK